MNARRSARLALVLLVVPALLPAQRPLAERIRAAGTRTVAFSARARAGVCGDGVHTYSDGLGDPGSRYYEGAVYSHGPWERTLVACDAGPVRVTLRVVEGVPSWLRVAVGPLPVLGDSVQDFGAVSTADAGDFLRTLARAGDGRASTSALFPLVIIDSQPRWQILATAARDTMRLMSYRRRAADIMARAAAGTMPVDPDVDDIAAGHRREAVYALARKREKSDDTVPQLIDIARSNKHRDARAAALYSLGQTADARAIELFTTMLGNR
jgi:hypothetical protein